MKLRDVARIILPIVIILSAIFANTGKLLPAAASESSVPYPIVAIHVSEITQALESVPAGPNTPKPPATPDASGYEWWYTAWHYFVMPESIKEALRSDGTPFVVVTDADITAGRLLQVDGSPRYPILISLAAEAIRDDEIAPLRSYVGAGGYLLVGSSSFTRYPDGTARGNFALSQEMGLRSHSTYLNNVYENGYFTKVYDHRILSHIPGGSLSWNLPLTSEQIPLGDTNGHVVHQLHKAWAVDTIGATVIATGSSGPLMAVKDYGDGKFIYQGIMQPLVGLGGNDPGMHSYLIFRKAIEWAFESFSLPIIKLSPWRYEYDSAFIVRHDYENNPASILSIESNAQAEQAIGVKGEYYFCTGVVREGSLDTQLSPAEKLAAIQSLRRAVSLYGATIGSHNGGLANPVNPSLPPSSYDYWHWGPDEALDTYPIGYPSGQAYANSSLAASFQDIEGWVSGLDNGRPGCGSSGSCPRTWVSPYFNSGRDGSFEVLEQLGVAAIGEQKLSPFPHWTLSTNTNGKRYTHLSLPVSDWYVGSEIAQSLEQHSDSTMRDGVNFFYENGFLVNFYGHGSNYTYSSFTAAKPRIWSTNSVGIYDWWLQRSPVVVIPSYHQENGVAVVTAEIANAADPETAIELVIPGWSTEPVENLHVFLNGVEADSNSFRSTGFGIKVRVGSSASAVEVRYDLPVPEFTTAIGETNILASDDSGNGNLLIAQQANLSEDATIQSLSFYIATASGQLRLGIYDDAGGKPGVLRAQTIAFTPTAGWNTQSVVNPVLLPAGSYWLAYLPQNNNMHYRVGSGGFAWGVGYTFGSLPATFPSTQLNGDFHWSLNATFSR